VLRPFREVDSGATPLLRSVASLNSAHLCGDAAEAALVAQANRRAIARGRSPDTLQVGEEFDRVDSSSAGVLIRSWEAADGIANKRQVNESERETHRLSSVNSGAVFWFKHLAIFESRTVNRRERTVCATRRPSLDAPSTGAMWFKSRTRFPSYGVDSASMSLRITSRNIRASFARYSLDTAA
jgi:hypothetical protein